MTTKFTPYPWKVLEIAGSDGVYGVYADAENAFVALTISGPNKEANARLIAAAPELYEALRDFFENPDFVCTVGGNPIRVEAMMARARAALAKARGEQ